MATISAITTITAAQRHQTARRAIGVWSSNAASSSGVGSGAGSRYLSTREPYRRGPGARTVPTPARGVRAIQDHLSNGRSNGSGRGGRDSEGVSSAPPGRADRGGAMRQRTGFRLGIAMVLVGAFPSTAMAQAALAQETTGATGSRGRRPEGGLHVGRNVRARHVEPDGRVFGHLVLLLDRQLSPARRLRCRLRSTEAEPGIRRVRLGPGDRHRVHRRRHALHVHDPRRPRVVRRGAPDRRGRRLHVQPVQEQPRVPAAELPHADGRGRPRGRREQGRVRHHRTDVASTRARPLHVLLHPAASTSSSRSSRATAPTTPIHATRRGTTTSPA